MVGPSWLLVHQKIHAENMNHGGWALEPSLGRKEVHTEVRVSGPSMDALTQLHTELPSRYSKEGTQV